MMSRRRRRDETNEADVHSENESQAEDGEKVSDYTDSEEDEDLDASEYESVDEEEHHSSEEEQEPAPPPADSVDASDGDPGSRSQMEAPPEVAAEEETPVVETERESGDGKEQSDTEQHGVEGEEGKDVKDEEEDPAFIPTKGAFFQHDLRSESQPKGRGRERKIWDKGPVKWSHDMFIMEEQMPKSRDHLISEYGYDIRSRPIDAPAPNDSRRSRGRGRGRGRGSFRGRRGRPVMTYDERPPPEYNNNTDEYQHDYPSLSNKSATVKHKSRSYWKTDYKRTQQNQETKFGGSTHPKNERTDESSDTQSNKENSQSQDSKPTAGPGEVNDEKFLDILDVINNHEQGKGGSQSTATTKSRSSDKQTKSHTPHSYSNYQEPPKPRRYSSLRQRSTNSPVDKQMSGQYSQRGYEPRYSNFAKPAQPTETMTFENKNMAGQSNNLNLQTQAIKEEPQHVHSGSPTVEPHQVASQPLPVSASATSTQQPPTVTFPDPAAQPSLGAPLDPSLLQMPPMALPYNPMLNPMYFDPGAYQRMMQMMSRMGMDQMQTPVPSLPHLDSGNSAIPPDAQTLPHPAQMQMNPLLPPVSQGSLGSIMRPPPQPLNPPTYFTGPMGLNPAGMPQQPFPFSPNLMAQQVGGVTYFNTPHSPPTLPPAMTQQESPRRNAAIPIMAPTGFAPGME